MLFLLCLLLPRGVEGLRAERSTRLPAGPLTGSHITGPIQRVAILMPDLCPRCHFTDICTAILFKAPPSLPRSSPPSLLSFFVSFIKSNQGDTSHLFHPLCFELSSPVSRGGGRRLRARRVASTVGSGTRSTGVFTLVWCLHPTGALMWHYGPGAERGRG